MKGLGRNWISPRTGAQSRRGRRALLLVLLLALLVAPGAQHAVAVSPDVVISQVYGGGGNTGAVYTHDFVELFNRGTAPVSLAGWSIQYASATGTGNFGANSGQLTELPAVTLNPGQYFLVQEASTAAVGSPLPTADVVDTTPIAMSGTAGKVALVMSATGLGCNGGSAPCSPAQEALIRDRVGYGNANYFEGAVAPAPSNSTAILRNGGGCVETDNNAADFATGTPTPRNMASAPAACSGPPAPTNPSGSGSATPASAFSGQSVVLRVAVTTGQNPTSSGLAVSADLSAIGGSASQPFFDDGSNGDTTAGDNTFSFATVVGAVTPGAKSLPATITDAQGRSGSAAIAFTVAEILPIGTVQGSVADGTDGTLHRSAYAPASGIGAGTATITVQAVVTQKTLARSSAGALQNGIFLQNTAATADADPNSSDGIFVFMGTFNNILRADGGPAYVPQVGDEILLSGRVSEFFNLSQISGSVRLVQVIRSGVNLDAETPAFDVNPPDNQADANRYWERHEGMRGTVPAGSLTVDGRDVFLSTFDSEIWLMRGDHPVSQRADPYARRVFRDAHPLDNQEPPLFDDGNGYRFLLGGFGVKATTGDSFLLLPPARTFESLNSAVTGGVYYSFSKYQVMVSQQPAFTPGVDPALNNPPQAFNRAAEFSISTFNLENLYDFRDDPFDGCDFTGNGGCPGVNPPFDYVPASEAAYQARLGDIATQIIAHLHAPDVLLVQEAEDQDFCVVAGPALNCAGPNNADGKPDTLQDLALRIAALGGPAYDAALDRNGADDRGITAGFLYRTDRVELLPADAGNPVLGSAPTVSYRGAALAFNSDVQNPKALNADLPDDVDISTGVDGDNVYTRAPQVGLFRIWRDGIGSGTSFDLYAISNHFSSTPNARVGQRTEQAAYNAAIVAALQAADADAAIASGGDFNVYPRPDDAFEPGNPYFGKDQLGPLYNAGLVNLFDTNVTQTPVSAYGYVFQGQTQTLDQIFVTPALFAELVQVRIAHINADFAADYDGDVARGTSDHDPQTARFCRDVTAPVLNVTLSQSMLWPPNHQMQRISAAVSVSDDSGEALAFTLVGVTSSEPDNGTGDGDTAGDVAIVDATTFDLRAERAGSGNGRVYYIQYTATDSCGNVGTGAATVTVPTSMGKNTNKVGSAALDGAGETMLLPMIEN